MSASAFAFIINAVFAIIILECNFVTVGSSSTDSFHVTNVPNEFIVTFHFKYYPKVRESFVKTRLVKRQISNWSIVPRQNFATQYPSDFDILHISDANDSLTEHIRKILEAHPAVKAVVPQRSVQRLLASSYNYNNNSLNYYIRQLQGVARKRYEKLGSQRVSISLHADVLWKLGVTGNGVKVAIFDTGLTQDHPHFRNVKERTNWTNETSLDDTVSHGTFVAGVIASSRECLGLAPDAELHIYKVFTNSQVSFTSWFLDAFNYAIYKKVHIINLSIGGPDFMDAPFVEKVLELSANNIVMVSAAGNDGPIYGTLNNPGDQSDVIGVGSINFDDKISRFSSRGMSTWELPLGYGRAALDIVTYGSQVEGSDVHSGCKRLSGTSVSSPVVAGVAALLRSGAAHKIDVVNPSSLKQVLVEGAEKLANYNIFEQGQGKLSLINSLQLLLAYKPKITLIPSSLDFTSNYMWPYSSQPLFYGSTSTIVNVTILNGIAVTGKVIGQPKWIPDLDNYGRYLNISTSFSTIIWPWTGWMSVYIAVNKHGENFEGIAKGRLILLVETIALGANVTQESEVQLPITIKITPKPPRHKRILWDQYHSLSYPRGYIPRDDLKIKADPLDWRGDHIHTNFRETYIHLRNTGYYVDILREPYSCIKPSEYGVLLIVDPEEEFFEEEILSLEKYVYEDGLSVVVFADWYNTTVIKTIKFYDENSRQWWYPDTGGANVPALNDLLSPFGIAFGEFVGEGYFKLGDHSMYYASGTTIGRFPNNPDDVVIGASLNDQGEWLINEKSPSPEPKVFLPVLGLFRTAPKSRLPKKNKNKLKSISFADEKSPNPESKQFVPILGLFQTTLKTRQPRKNKKNILIAVDNTELYNKSENAGRVVVYGDSNCLDSTHMEKPCYWLLTTILDFAMNSHKSVVLENLNRISDFKQKSKNSLPTRFSSSNLKKFSNVIGNGKIAIAQCEEREWAPEATYNESRRMELEIDSTEASDNQYKEFIENLNAELAKKKLIDDKYDQSIIEFSILLSALFLTSLSVTVIMIFALFLRGKALSKIAIK